MTDQAQAFARAICAAVKIPLPPGMVQLGCRIVGIYRCKPEHRPYDSARWEITALTNEQIERLRTKVILLGVEPYSNYLRARPGRENTIDILAQYFESLLLAISEIDFEQFEREEPGRRELVGRQA